MGRVWGWLKKAKDLFSWYSFGSNVLGIFGLTGAVSGVAAIVAGVVGGVIKALPWPFVLMAAYCTFVGLAYVAVLPIIVGSIRKATDALSASASAAAAPMPAKKEPVRPFYEAWRHVEKFTVREAAYLWADIEPTSKVGSLEANAWIDALCGAIRTDKLQFIPKNEGLGFGDATRALGIALQKKNVDMSTEINRKDLIGFARKNGYKPNFLKDELN